MAFTIPYKAFTKIILGNQWFQLIELLAPEAQRHRQDSLYWQLEYYKAFSTKFICDPITRDIVQKAMILNIGRW